VRFYVSYSAGGSLQFIEFDATTRETHTSVATVTESPVEKGVNVADHIRNELDKFSCEAVVTNTPIRVPLSNLDGTTGKVRNATLTFPVKNDLPIAIPGVGAALKGAGVLDSTGTMKVSVLQFDSPFDRVSSVYHELKTLQETGTLVTLTTSLREYGNMVLRSISAPRASGEGGMITFSLDFVGIRFVETTRVDAPKNKKTTASKKKNDGSKPYGPPPPEKSVAYSLKEKYLK
jgi:hypothetical protein